MVCPTSNHVFHYCFGAPGAAPGSPAALPTNSFFIGERIYAAVGAVRSVLRLESFDKNLASSR
jgi:hypothetical protein